MRSELIPGSWQLHCVGCSGCQTCFPAWHPISSRAAGIGCQTQRSARAPKITYVFLSCGKEGSLSPARSTALAAQGQVAS